MNGVGVVCFLASYSVVFALELWRFAAKSVDSKRRTRFAALVVATLGAIAHGAFLYYNDLLQNDRFIATGSGWFFVSAFCVVVAYLYLSFARPKTPFGLFLLPLVFALSGVGIGIGDAPFAPDAACRYVRAAHGVALSLAAVLTFVGATTGAMFFRQRSRMKRKIFASESTLPSLEWLDRATRFSTDFGLLALGVGVVAGYYLKIFAVGPDSLPVWRDPVALGATALFVAIVVRRFVRSRSNRADAAEIATSTLVCFGAFVVLLLVVAFGRGHWRRFAPPTPETSAPSPAAPVSANQPDADVDATCPRLVVFPLSVRKTPVSPIRSSRFVRANVPPRVPFPDVATLKESLR